MRHAFPFRRRHSFLASLRSPFIGWLQVITASLWILLPAPVVNSYWHDTNNDGIPEFYSDPPSPWDTEDADSDGLTNGEESTFGSSPFIQDSDNDGLSDVQEYTISQVLGSNLNPWDPDTDHDGINDYWDSDPLIPLDTDGDGIPDYYDSYPNDPTNDTSYWSGGQFWIDAVLATIGSTAYSTSAGPIDSDGDGIIDAADPYDYDAYNNTTWWNGGTFRINGVEQNFGYTPYTTSSGTYDSDGDGIPDGLDPYVGDSSNNTIWWNGGNFLFNGDSQHFFYGVWTTPGDADNDGIPDGSDPYPNDSTNNSIWYDTLYYWSDGIYGFVGSGWYSASSGNVDGDSLPDVLDPYPNDPTNNTSWWYGGTYWINGAPTMITLTDPFAWATTAGMFDEDSDGIYDSVDPYLNDPANNTAFWQGGNFWIDGYQQGFSADVYGYNASNGMQDSDSDGIPDAADLYVNDSSNNTGYWGGGTFLIAGQMVELLGSHYNYSMSSTYWQGDQDIDGIPDMADPYANDSSNYTIGFGGGSYVINGAMTELAAGYTAGVYADNDGDGIPDYFDPLPWDSTNNSSYWNGSSWWVDGLSQYFYSAYYATSDYADVDGDGLPDFWDAYVNDSTNNTSWWSGSFYSNGLELTFVQAPYATSSGTGDADSDGIPDGVDPYPYDNNNNTAYWGGGTWWIEGQERTWSTASPYSVNADVSDTDGDGIPNTFDPYYNDPTNYTISFGGGSYAINGAMTEFAAGHVSGIHADSDGDGIPDYFDPLPWDNTNNSSYWYGGQWLVDGNNQDFSNRYYATSAYGDVDNDGLLDLWDPYLNDSSNNTSWWSGSFYSDGLEYTYSQNPYATTGGTGDSDGDGIPNGMDPYPYDNTNNTAHWGGGTWWINGQEHTWMTTTPYAANADSGDADGDGILNVFDPYPNDPNNNTATFTGGVFRINGVLNEFGHYFYSADTGDADGDGIPDFLDPYIDDLTNNTSVWDGDYFYIDGSHMFLSGYRATIGDFDTDDDGIPDAHDPYPEDPTNNTGYWAGGAFVISGYSQTFDSAYYALSDTLYTDDMDWDGLPDFLDYHAWDSTNDTSWWGGGTFTINGVEQWYWQEHAYSTSGGIVDQDYDLIPDAVDPNPRDPNNDYPAWRAMMLQQNPFFGDPLQHYMTVEEWLDMWFEQDMEQRSEQPLYLWITGLDDTDIDGIPDLLEDYFGLDSLDPSDAEADPDETGFTNLERYLAGQNLNDPDEPLVEWLGDFLPNVWKLHYGFDMFDNGVAFDDPDEDGLLNLLEYYNGTDPLVADTDGDGVGDGAEAGAGTTPGNGGSGGGAGTGGSGGSGGTGGNGGNGSSGGNSGGGRQHEPNDTEDSPMPMIWLAHRDSWVALSHNGTFQYEYRTVSTLAEAISLGSQGWETVSDNTDENGATYWTLRKYTRYEATSGSYVSLNQTRDVLPQDIVAPETVVQMINEGTSYSGDITQYLEFVPPVPSLSDRLTQGHDDTFDYASSGDLSSYRLDVANDAIFPGGHWADLWLRADEPVPRDVTKSFVLKIKTGSSGGVDQYQYKVVSLTIPKGMQVSVVGQTDGESNRGVFSSKPTTPDIQQSLASARVKEVSFSGEKYHQLQSDNLTRTYSAPHWMDTNSDGEAKTDFDHSDGERNYPVAFTRSSTPKVSAKFYIPGVESGKTVRIRATSPNSFGVPATVVTPEGNSEFSLPPTTSSHGTLNIAVDFHNADDETAFKIDWEVKIGDGAWNPVGTTKHTVYLTLGDPIGAAASAPCETLFQVGCYSAKSKGASEQAVVDAIYNEFTDQAVYQAKKSSGSPEKLMTYWKDGVGVLTSQEFLPMSDPNGRCGAWAQFFIDCCRAQGIDNVRLVAVTPPAVDYTEVEDALAAALQVSKFDIMIARVTPLFWVKRSSSNFDPPPLLFTQVWENAFQGIPGQTNKNPPKKFQNHAVVFYGGKLYDPSYGTPAVLDVDAWDSSAVDYIGGEVIFRVSGGSVTTIQFVTARGGSNKVDGQVVNY